MRRVYFLLFFLLLIPFVSANTYLLRKAYSGRVVDGQNEIIFLNTTITLAKGDIIKFQFKPTDAGYLYVLDHFSGKEVVFLTPNKELVAISEGTSHYFDSNSDGILDLDIFVKTVYTTGATVYATPISIKINETTTQQEQPSQQEAKPPAPEKNVSQEVKVSVENSSAESKMNKDATTNKKSKLWPALVIIIVLALVLAASILILKAKRKI
ncbi:MAG: hypothetical protein QXW00_01930 [Candidatus Woesearchaeota archaeon]